MNFFTNCYIPSCRRQFRINKLKFGDYFELNYYIQNSDFEGINDTFNSICEKSMGCSTYLTNLDKFFILVHLKIIFLNPILKLSAKNEDNESISYEVLLKDILDNCKQYKKNNFKLPTNLYYEDSEDILKEISYSIDEIKDHINDNKILMFETPDVIKNVPKIYLNCFDNTLFYFCKLLYRTNLNDLYRKISLLKKHFNFSLSEINSLSPKELDVFLNTK